MESPTGQPQQSPYRPGMPDRRRRKPDVWARVFRWITWLVYPLLLVVVLVFLTLADAHSRKNQLAQIDRAVAAADVGGDLNLSPLVPILIAGLAVGVVGLALSRVRARRRHDYNYKTQLVLIVLSAGGLLIYFILQRLGIIG